MMYESYKTLSENNIKVFSVKTDAFTLLPSDLDRAKTLLDFSPGIGKWRVSKTEDIIYPFDPLKYKQNNEMPIKELSVNVLDVPDEFDTPSIAQQLIKYKQVCNFGTVPGVGKSYACKFMEELGYNLSLIHI